jgi:hypothetical protein
MNLCLQRAVRAAPLVLMLAAAGALANQNSGTSSATMDTTPDTGLTALGPGRIVLYEYPNFGGAKVTIDSGIARDLDWTNFSNSSHHATSAKVESGTWKVCSQAAFQGECRVIGPGEYPALGASLLTGIASAEPVVRPELGAASLR